MGTFKLIRDMGDNLSLERLEVINMLREKDIQFKEYEEAEEDAKDYILETLWAFNLDFLGNYINGEIDTDTIKIVQEHCCENANALIKELTKHCHDELVSDAIGADGIGHFLNTYDGNAYEYFVDGKLYLYWRV